MGVGPSRRLPSLGCCFLLSRHILLSPATPLLLHHHRLASKVEAGMNNSGCASRMAQPFEEHR